MMIVSPQMDRISDGLSVVVCLALIALIAFYVGRLRQVTLRQLRTVQTDLEQQVADLGRLHEFGQTLVAAGDEFETSLRAVLEQALEFSAGYCGFVAVRRRGANCFDALVHAGPDAARHPGLDSIAVGVDADPSAIQSRMAAAVREAGYGDSRCTPLLDSAGRVMAVVVVKYLVPASLSERQLKLTDMCTSMGAAKLERSMARAMVVDQERRFNVALDSAVVPFNIMDAVRNDDGRLIDMRMVYLNPAAAHLMRRPVEECIGRRLTEILPRFWDRPGLFERYETVLATQQPVQFELPSSPHNPGMWFNISISPLKDSVAVWFEDITERKQRDQAQADADRRKDEFLATLAHELRNPLAPIRQGVRVARSAAASEAQVRWSHEVIERQVGHMALLLDDLLDVSRISRGTLLLRRSRVDLAGVIEAALEVARPHIEAKNHHLDVQGPAAALTVDIDPLRIAQVIGNLLTNAAKYTDPGGTIRLGVTVCGSDLAIQVRDTGIGLTVDQMSQLFEMFAQAPAAIARSQGGLGIGLALARSLVRLHGGDIDVDSAGLGCGSEFTIRLPGCVSAQAVGGQLCRGNANLTQIRR